MTTIGTAVLQIIPSLKGVTDAIDKQIDGKVVEVKVVPKVDQAAAKKAGKDTGEAIAAETKDAVKKADVGKAVADEVKSSVKKAKPGTEIGRAISDDLKTSVKTAAPGKEIAKVVAEDVKKVSPGREIAKIFVEGLAQGVKQGLPEGSIGGQIIDNIAAGVNKGIESKGLGKQILGSIGDVLKKGNLSDTIKDAVQPGISQVGTLLKTGAGEWSHGIALALLTGGDIKGAADGIANTVVATTDQIAGIGEAFGLPADAIRQFGIDSAGEIGDLGTKVQDVVNTIGEFKGAAELAGIDMDKAFAAVAKGPGLVGLAAAVTALVLTIENLEHKTAADNAKVQDYKKSYDAAKTPEQRQAAHDTAFPDDHTSLTQLPQPGSLDYDFTVAEVQAGHLPGIGYVNGKFVELPKKAGGGMLSGPGTGTSDSILMRGSTGEFVVNANATRKNLPLLEIINSDKLPGYAGGGLVAGDQQLRQIIMQRFGISNIGGYRPADKYGEHSTGRALDVMVGGDKAKGDAVKDFALANASAIDLKWAIWRQHLYYPGGGGYDMPDRGSPTQNHMDHVHIFSGTGITNGLLGALAGGGAKPVAVAVAGPGAEDTSSSDQTTPSSTSQSSGGISLASSFSGLAGTGLGDLKGPETGPGKRTFDYGKGLSAAVSGQVSSALGVFGVGDSPPILNAASQLLGQIGIGGGHAAPRSATSAGTGAPLPDAPHGTLAGQAPGPVFNTNIGAFDTRDALNLWQSKTNERVAAQTGKWG